MCTFENVESKVENGKSVDFTLKNPSRFNFDFWVGISDCCDIRNHYQKYILLYPYLASCSQKSGLRNDIDRGVAYGVCSK